MRNLLATALAGALLLVGCGGGEQESSSSTKTTSPAATAGDAVEIKTFIFKPKPLQVKAGTTVTWTNRDATIHTVVSGTRAKPDAKAFKGSLDQNGTFEHTFTKPGRYRYFCDRHSGNGMTGEVVVS